ncbi:spore coat protein [Ectobacillus sp. sgz5001026]|uniref:spore coat protein n=1 Tax=Ectobacillus sp. sgz5001026 TaxID=3242473 RepID=UPI0036D273DE
MQNAQDQMHQNMHIGNVPQQMNHGGHEMFDVHEILSGTISTLNQYLLLSQYVKDPELLDILNRQYSFIQDEYNLTVECFQTGQDPSKPTQSYKMKQNNDFIYGVKATQPKKPMASVTEITDEWISSCMLGSVKSGVALKAMAALEVTNPVVRRVLADSVPNCIEMAYEISIYQNKHNYYQIPQLAPQDMQLMMSSYTHVQGQPQMQNNNMTH